MKKTLIILSLSALLLSACSVNNKTVKNPVTIPETDTEYKATQSQICSSLCERQIQTLCQSEIEDFQSAGQSLDGSIMEEASCQLMCEADWDESIFACISDADECAQLSNEAPYCMETEANDDEESQEDVLPGNCNRACQNYKKCASYGDDISASDLQDAYNSCNELCRVWDNKTRDCVAQTVINAPIDCAKQTACVLKDVKELMNR